jgi:predicted nucleic-acid-binding protein
MKRDKTHTNNTTMKKSELKQLIREVIEEVMEQQATENFVVNGKQVDVQSIQIDGVRAGDYSDAHISSATFTDGVELNDKELDQLNSMAGDWIAQKAIEGDV